jgi:heme/copper-type cytochrome/quinol oxidase subunit 3
MVSVSSTPFHLVKPSSWPICVGIFLLTSLLYTVMQFHYEFSDTLSVIYVSSFFVLWTAFSWWFDVCVEAYRGGHHTSKVRSGIRMAMLLFIFSEVMFFFGFFWAFFHSSLAPVYNIGGVWPPQGIDLISPWGVPLLNTVILLTSGATVTKSHHAIIKNQESSLIYNLDLTLILAILFTKLQVMEYSESTFIISDSVYSSIFYLMTGFHGIHVFIGTCFLFVCLIRIEAGHFSRNYHFGFEAAIWYWHFVDVVWILLFICLYWWGGASTISINL